MKRDAIEAAIIRIFEEKFEIVDPKADDNLRDAYEFDSIDAVELLHEIEILLDTQLTQAEKKNAMEIRTINQILDYIEALAHDRRSAKSSGSDPCLSIVEQ
jgi:acyl carrier protein